MDYFKLDQTSIDAIAYKAAKIVVSELKKCEEPQLEMVPAEYPKIICGVLRTSSLISRMATTSKDVCCSLEMRY